MKKSFSKILSAAVTCAVLAASAIFTFSCTGFNYNGDVSFVIDGSKIFSSKNVTAGDSGYYLVASVNGQYQDYRMIKMDSVSDKYSIDFNAIPVGQKVSIGVNIYKPDDDQVQGVDIPTLHKYSGTSDEFYVVPGNNKATVKISELPIELLSSVETYGQYGDNNIYNLFFYYQNGKYFIKDSNNNIVSEGLYTADDSLNDAETIIITEYIYTDYGLVPDLQNPGSYRRGYTEKKIVTNPVPQNAYISPGHPRSIGFTSSNGIYYGIQLES